MNVGDEYTRSVWLDDGLLPDRPPLAANARVEVAIVGGGIAGLSIAYELARAGRQVLVLDRGRIGHGQSARTTGHLAWQLDDYYHELRRRRGDADARGYYERAAAAVARVGEIAEAEAIACDYARVPGYLFAASPDDAKLLNDEKAAVDALGILGVDFAERAPVPGIDTGPALVWPDQARFHVLKYLDGLARAIERLGGRLHGDSAVTETKEEGDTVSLSLESGHAVVADTAVLCANIGMGDLRLLPALEPWRSYAIAGAVPKGSVADALVWDTLDAYHYVRIQPGDAHDVLIVGGEDQKLGDADDGAERLDRLEAWTRAHYPMWRGRTHGWSGMVIEPADALPYSGLLHGRTRTYLHTGDSGEGLSNGVLGTAVLRDEIVGGGAADAKRYAVTRTTLAAAPDIAGALGHTAANFVEYLTPGGASSVESLRPGEAALVRHGLKKNAAYRDETGRLHERSAVCTHLGCIVHWNSLERSWDCPCHGSQFAPDGQVLSGPAVAPLGEP